LNNIAQIRNNIPQDNVSEIFATKCSKRLGQAQEIANMVVFLISDLCCFCTGTHIIVDGGMTI
jgi:NAD(P)-dependent dehydrogenase (short-subunit alcohol dehydrogenase family)